MSALTVVYAHNTRLHLISVRALHHYNKRLLFIKFVGFIAPCNSNHKLFLLFSSNNLTPKPQFDSGGKT